MKIKYTAISNSETFIKWDPKFKIGIPVIDKQHETLVNLCDEFYQSLLRTKDSENYHELIKETLDKCLNYAATHFKEEERLMLASGFDGYKEHKASHDAFTEKCKINSLRIDSISITEAIKFAHFLYDWINTHIAHEDRLYLPALVEFLKKQQSAQ
ncbi:MAG: hemerythrin family protein [Treponema sp.]|nr:hemerythrin family protein [Treponema sp.]